MDSFGGLFKFFYNIIPGTLFLLGLNVLDVSVPIYFPKSDAERIFWFIVIGIFLGFIGQAVMKTVKGMWMNKALFNAIKEENTENGIYDSAMAKMRTKLDINKTSKISLRHSFFAMDNFLRNSSTMFVVNDFSEKAAFWGNIFIGSVVLFLISSAKNNPLDIVFLILIVVSLKLTYEYSKAERDSILQTYAQTQI